MESERSTAAAQGARHHDRSIEAVAAGELAKGLSLLRASTIASTRLQLALARRDRPQTLAALDGLVELDAELERVVDGLAEADGADDDLSRIRDWLAAQKAALASEKFSLVCGISGSGLVSPPERLATPVEEAAPDGPAPMADDGADLLPAAVAGLDEPEPARRRRPLVLLSVVLLVMIIAAAGALLVLEPELVERMVAALA